MRTRLRQTVHSWLERRFPERRLFLRSDAETRFIRLSPETQLLAWGGTVVVVGWAIIATAIILIDSIGAGNYRAQAQRDQVTFERRISALSDERDMRAEEARAAQDRFASALSQISTMQSELLASEDQRRELETGIEVVQSTLRRVIDERKTAEATLTALRAQIDGSGGAVAVTDTTEMAGTVGILSDALAQTAEERDRIIADAADALAYADEMELELRLLREKNDQIFRQLEEAMMVSVEPLDNMFRSAGMDPDRLIDEVRRGYSGQGGPLEEIQFSTRGGLSDPETDRANAILERMDELNLYRLAAQKAPLVMPVGPNVRFTSGFGPRWGRMHYGADFAGPIGTPIFATADGVVTEAGWASGYGRLIKIRHAFGVETRYAHLSDIRVSVGQRVERGDRIGDLGNSGRSTGPHLHYEIRVNGVAKNPMTYIRAGRDVF